MRQGRMAYIRSIQSMCKIIQTGLDYSVLSFELCSRLRTGLRKVVYFEMGGLKSQWKINDWLTKMEKFLDIEITCSWSVRNYFVSTMIITMITLSLWAIEPCVLDSRWSS